MRDTSTGNGKVVVNRSMSLDGFTAGPGDAMDWVFDFVAPDEFPEIMAATGAMLIGRRTYEVAKRMAGQPSGEPSYDGELSSSSPTSRRTRRTRRSRSSPVISGKPSPRRCAPRAARTSKSGADVTGQCLQRGLVDEILVYVLPVLLGDGIRFFSSPSLARIDLEPLDNTRSGAVTILRFRVRK